MKIKHAISLASALVFLSMQCAAQREADLAPVPSLFPGISLTDSLSRVEKGKALYKKKCASCHGIFQKGKDSIPDFSKQELQSYKVKFIQEDPLNHAFSQKMTDQELNDVMYFLETYIRPAVADSLAKVKAKKMSGH